MSKYLNKKTVIDGITFDSKKEALHYCELMEMEEQGLIHNLRLQVPYELVPVQREGKKVVERALTYKADFVYETCTGKTVVEDVKGKKTELYIAKRKLMLWKYGIKIREV